MGLDLIEFTMVLEDSFGVSIPDADLATMTTPRRVIDYLTARLPHTRHDLCLEQRAFHRLRAGVMRAFELPRASVRTDTPWKLLLGPQDKRRRWRLLQHAVAMPIWPAGVTLWGTHTKKASTVGATARYLAAYASSALKQSSEGWTRAEVARVVTSLMSYEFAISDFTEDSRFVADLGLG